MMIATHDPQTTTTKENPTARARAELVKRTHARNRLIEFCQYVDPTQADEYGAKHLRLIADHLERAENGTLWDGMNGEGLRMLIISTPPRHWKSSLISRKFAAWFVGKRKRDGGAHQVIITSYAASLAESHNRAVIETVMSKQYQQLFADVRLSTKSQSVTEWAIDGESFPTCVAAGVGGGLTGHGADCLIIDDPIKDAFEANSPNIRQRLWEFWETVAKTRINPNGFVVIVMTRWNVDDLVGRLFEQIKSKKSDDRIVNLRLPALAETDHERVVAHNQGIPLDPCDPMGRTAGAALWPERIGWASLLAVKKSSPRVFDALYQGKPTPVGGFLAHRGQFKALSVLPVVGKITWCWGTDWALTGKESAPKGGDPDYTVAALVGLWRDERNKELLGIIIADVVRGQHELHAAKRMVKKAVLTRPALVTAITNGRKTAVDYIALNDMMRDPDLLGVRVKTMDMAGDKVQRSQIWLERAQAGLVFVLEGGWNEAFFGELESFPHGAHDDQIDAVSAAVNGLGMGARSKKAHSARIAEFG